MTDICETCGLPKDLCVCETIAKETSKITVSIEKKKFGKLYTIITGVDMKEIDINNLVKSLKSKLACGGTIKDGRIELQGDHKNKMRSLLIEFGFVPETITIK
jgi:translation initiation factor 1